jgi:hypothetical protein
MQNNLLLFVCWYFSRKEYSNANAVLQNAAFFLEPHKCNAVAVSIETHKKDELVLVA